ncbi:MAG: phage minor head protein, partial [Alphaproteobacteria bacterium]
MTIQYPPQDVLSGLESIYGAMQLSDRGVREVANDHILIFNAQMRAASGMHSIALPQEPYLEAILAQHQLNLVKRLEQLFQDVYALLPPEFSSENSKGRSSGLTKSADFISCSVKAFTPSADITTGVEREIAMITVLTRRELMQELDIQRQRLVGVRRYIWHTQGDERVRPSHAANAGKTFSYDKPPPTGHPGDAPRCRCWAEPLADDADDPNSGEFDVAVAPAILLTPEIAVILAATGAVLLKVSIDNMQGDRLFDNVPEEETEKKPPANNSPEGGDNQDPDDDDKFRKIAESISHGHAYEKHKDEFPDLKTKEELKEHVEKIINNPDKVKDLERGRTGYWDRETGTVVIHDPNNIDQGTVFKPQGKEAWFDNILK